MNFRHYNIDDKEQCLSIFESNLLTFLADEERQDFVEFLENPPDEYYVIEVDNGEVIACGGYKYRHDHDVVKLRWGMVHQSHQNRGVGRFLLERRIGIISKDYPSTPIIVDTSQLTSGFYAKFGFRTIDIVEDGIAPGLDHYLMELKDS